MSKLNPTQWKMYGHPGTEPDVVTLTLGDEEKPGDKSIRTDNLELSFIEARDVLNFLYERGYTGRDKLREICAVVELINEFNEEQGFAGEMLEKIAIKAKVIESGKAGHLSEDELQDLAVKLHKFPGIPAEQLTPDLIDVSLAAYKEFQRDQRDSSDDLPDDEY